MIPTGTTQGGIDAGGLAGLVGTLRVEKFGPFTAGNVISKLQLSINKTGAGQTFALHDDNSISAKTGWDGNIWVEKFTGLDSGSSLNQLQLSVTANGSGHIRIKAYQDDGAAGAPSTLLGESGSQTITGTGLKNYTISGTVPTSGNVWVGFEVDSTTTGLNYHFGGGCSIYSAWSSAHVYGPGPSPFGSAPSCNAVDEIYMKVYYTEPTPHVRIKAYQDDGGSGFPGTLLGESGSQVISGTGLQNFTLGATVPANGNIWVGWEGDNSITSINYHSAGCGGFGACTYGSTHTYGSGPSPFGANPTGDTLHVFYEKIFYTNTPFVTVKFDGSTLSTSPSPILTNGTGGFSGTFTVPSTTFGIHTVNASDTLGNFATHTFTVPYAISTFTITGYILGPNGIFPYPSLKVISSGDLNMTQLQLYNATNLLQSKSFSPPIHIFANTTMTIPWNFTDATSRTGSQTYTEQATITQSSFSQVISSNAVTLNYGSYTIGKLGFNYTNPVQVPIWFIRSDSGSNTRLSVIFPNAANLTCNLAYQTAQTNQTYYNIPKVTYDTTQKNSSFLFMNSTNDFIKVNCKDLNNLANTGQYVLTITNFPLVQQIQNFRSGMYGTTGQFGMLDIITLSVVIFSMIGFNRINEAVGAFFSLSIIGVCAYFSIISWPGVVIGAIAVVTVLAVTSVRKIGGF